MPLKYLMHFKLTLLGSFWSLPQTMKWLEENAMKRCWRMVLEMTLVANLNYGPFGSAGWYWKKPAKLDMFMESNIAILRNTTPPWISNDGFRNIFSYSLIFTRDKYSKRCCLFQRILSWMSIHGNYKKIPNYFTSRDHNGPWVWLHLGDEFLSS